MSVRSTQTGAGRLAGLIGGVAVFALAAILAGCSPTTSSAGPGAATVARPQLVISAASSLRGVLTSVTPGFEQASGASVVVNYGATGQLLKQIEGGAPADLLLAASPSAVATLVADGLASADATVTFAGNALVILVPTGNPAGVRGPIDLQKAKRLATADPLVAPQGQKAQEWLAGLDLWNTLKPAFVFAANAAQTDEYVARGEVDAAIGFASDAKGRADIESVYVVPDSQVKQIRYVGVPISSTKQDALAGAYLDYLLSVRPQAAFVSAGFKPAPAR